MGTQGLSTKRFMTSLGFKVLLILCASTMALAQTNPVPLIYLPLEPMSAAPGGAQFTLGVNGANFVSGATVNWGQTALATTFLTASRLTATVPSADLTSPTTVVVTVTNPAPGGGTSNPQYFTVTSTVTAFDFFDSVLPVNVGPPATNPGPDYGLVAGDFNGDGKMDLVYLNTSNSTVVVLLGNGDGTFQAAQIFPVGSTTTAGATALVAADINGDGKLDLAVPDYAGGAIDILLGNGDGTFQPQIVVPTAPLPLSIAIADFNRDGKLDLAVGTGAANPNVSSSPTVSGGVSVLLGNGDGTFQTHMDYPIQTCTHDAFYFAASVSAITVGDFNNDGLLDIVAGASSGYVCYGFIFFPGKGDGTFGAFQNDAYTPAPTSLAPLGAPPVLGLIEGEAGPGSCTQCWVAAIFIGNANGTFEPDLGPQQITAPVGTSLVSGDFNGDGYLDYAFSDSSEPSGCNSNNFLCLLQFYLGSQAGTFQAASTTFIPTLQQTVGLVAADFNNDGKMDFATTSNNQVEILMQGTSPAASISPSSLANSTPVTLGTASMLGSATLTNGETALTVSSIAITGPNAGDFSETNTCGSGLSPNATCVVNISFTPSADGTRVAILDVYDNAGNSPQTVGLTGVGGVPPSTVGFSPSSLTFPAQYVGTSGLPRTVTVTNNGSGPLTISSVTTSIADFGTLSDCTNSVPPGTNCTIGVFFDPTTSGTRTGTLIVTDNASGSPQSVPLTGSGQDFSIAASGSSTATVSPGQTASYTLSLAPAGGFKQTVSLTCTGAPSQSTCTVPSSVTLDGSAATSVTVTVTTTAASAGLIQPGSFLPLSSRLALSLGLCGLPGLVILGVSGAGSRRGHRRLLYSWALVCVLSSLGLSSCASGSAGSGGGGGTPVTYNLTVTGSFTSGSTTLSHDTKLTLVVQ